MLQSPPGPEISFDGESYLNFTGTDYLGLASRKETVDAATEAIGRFGLSSSNVRTQYGTHEPLARAEVRLAAFFGTERAVFLQSGMSAAAALGQWLALHEKEPIILVDAAIHPAGHDLIRAAGPSRVDSFEHFNPTDLMRKLECLKSQSGRTIIVLTDSVAGGTGRSAPLNFYHELLRQTVSQAMLIVDESHSLGLLGPTGRGLLEAFDLPSFSADPSLRIVSLASTAKAIGVPGGVIPCDARIAAQLVEETPQGRAATPPSPATAAAVACNIEIVWNESRLRDSLAANRRRLVERLDHAGIPHIEVSHDAIPIVSLSLGTADRIRKTCDRLKQKGILVTHSRYTGTIGDGVLRIALRADHTAEQIDRLAAALEEAIF